MMGNDLKDIEDYAIVTYDLKYVYSPNTPFETAAINGVSVSIKKESFTCIIGHTGCGKSTLIQHFNGLITQTSGELYINGKEILHKGLKELRQTVGLVFQYPEQQLFEDTVYKDVAFGLTKLKYTQDEIDVKVKNAIEAVGLDKDILKRSIYELSGGQKRRVAIAGVFAMEPEILVLDEPTAGLDPKGREEILELLKKYHDEKKVTIVFVSHSMEDIAKLADYIIVMNDGKVEMEGEPKNIFDKKERLEEIGLSTPQVTHLMVELKKINPIIKSNCFTIKEALEVITDVVFSNNKGMTRGNGNVE